MKSWLSFRANALFSFSRFFFVIRLFYWLLVCHSSCAFTHLQRPSCTRGEGARSFSKNSLFMSNYSTTIIVLSLIVWIPESELLTWFSKYAIKSSLPIWHTYVPAANRWDTIFKVFYKRSICFDPMYDLYPIYICTDTILSSYIC